MQRAAGPRGQARSPEPRARRRQGAGLRELEPRELPRRVVPRPAVLRGPGPRELEPRELEPRELVLREPVLRRVAEQHALAEAQRRAR